LFLIGALVPCGCGLSYYFLESLVGTNILEPGTTWVELLVLEPWLDNCFGTLSGLSY